MPSHKNLTPKIKAQVVQAVVAKKTYRAIAEQFNIAIYSETYIMKQFKATGDVNRRPKPGRSPATTEKQDLLIARMSRKNLRATAVDIGADLRTSYGILISAKTVRRRLNDAGLNARRPVKKPLISKKNQIARLAFAQKFGHWTSKEWAKVLWSDESKFNLFGSDGLKYVRRPDGQRFKQIELGLIAPKHFCPLLGCPMAKFLSERKSGYLVLFGDQRFLHRASCIQTGII
jgi:transposase